MSASIASTTLCWFDDRLIYHIFNQYHSTKSTQPKSLPVTHLPGRYPVPCRNQYLNYADINVKYAFAKHSYPVKSKIQLLNMLSCDPQIITFTPVTIWCTQSYHAWECFKFLIWSSLLGQKTGSQVFALIPVKYQEW